jgi:hypothetical protein
MIPIVLIILSIFVFLLVLHEIVTQENVSKVWEVLVAILYYQIAP